MRLLAIHTPEATIAAAMIPRIPYTHGSRLAVCVDGFDWAGLLFGWPAPVGVLPEVGLYPPELGFGPGLGLVVEPELDPWLPPGPVGVVLPGLDPLLDLDPVARLNRWLRSRVVLVSIREA